jgi:5-methyltetrahydrofolate--homocysteine methyltransferase
MSDIKEQIQKDLYKGKAEEVKEAVQKAIDDGMPVTEILNDGLIAGMDIVGRDFKAGNLFIPEVLIAAKSMQAGLNILRPLLAESGAPSLAKIALGTVAGDLHDIGKNLVAIMLEGAGFDIIDLGNNVAPEKFVEAVNTEGVNLVGMSALLTTTMPAMKATIDALAEAGLRNRVKVIIGGAPVTAEFAKEIGADAYAPDAASAVDSTRSLIA